MRYGRITKADPGWYGVIPVLMPLILLTGCLCRSHAIQTPDRESFYAEVASPALRAQFDSAHLTPGMPYFVVDQLFAEWKNDRHAPVPSVGSRQELREEEGWGRVYHDPHIMTYLKTFNTDLGEVAVWYEYPDFYTADVIAGDMLAIYRNDTVMTSTICCLLGPRYIEVTDSLTGLRTGDTVFAEIQHIDNPRYSVSYWYRLEVDDPATYTLLPLGFDLYRIEHIEIDGDPADYFQWRIEDENR